MIPEVKDRLIDILLTMNSQLSQLRESLLCTQIVFLSLLISILTMSLVSKYKKDHKSKSSDTIDE